MQPVFNGFIWRYLFSMEIIRGGRIAFEGAYLEDELFLMEYFCRAQRLAVTEQPLYRYLLNPNSATHKYMKDLMAVFDRFMERKEDLARRYDLETARPRWRKPPIGRDFCRHWQRIRQGKSKKRPPAPAGSGGALRQAGNVAGHPDGAPLGTGAQQAAGGGSGAGRAFHPAYGDVPAEKSALRNEDYDP